MRIAEEVINELQAAQREQNKVIQKIEVLTKELQSLNKDAWEWVSVRKASEMLDVVPAVLYHKINMGKLTTKRIESKIFLNVNELKEINDLENYTR